MVICLELGANLNMVQAMPLPLAVSCFSKIQIGFTILVLAHLGSPRKRAVKQVLFLLIMRGRLYNSSVNGSETWPVRKENEVTHQQAEIRMVRCMCRVNVKDRVPSKELTENSVKKCMEYEMEVLDEQIDQKGQSLCQKAVKHIK